jgi:threonylcarbamoyladenosine tRNA methylthiotransferase MtaB
VKVYLHTTGCRLNQSEIETLGRQLLAQGHDVVEEPAAADTVVLNTCAVTTEAAAGARSLTRRFHRANATADIVLTGCYATLAPADLRRLPGVTHVVDNAAKDDLITLLDPTAPAAADYDREPLLRDWRAGSAGRTRAFVKVQDGCDNRCTFCVTTLARGAGRSRALSEVVAEVQAFAAAGYQEAVLTGVHLGSYGRDRDRPQGLTDLVSALLHQTDIPRLRLSSLEPWDIAPGFFNLWADPRLLPHLHLPLQSGSDAVLRRMARRTSQAAFSALVAEARAAIPDLHISTDLIAGFPGETAAEFADTLAYVEALGFGRLHVFGYSPRPGTAAARLPGRVAGPLKKERVRQLIELGDRLSLAFHREQVGRTRPVLWEGVAGATPTGLRWAGYTDNYIRVTAEGSADWHNRIMPVRLVGAESDGMTGEA